MTEFYNRLLITDEGEIIGKEDVPYLITLSSAKTDYYDVVGSDVSIGAASDGETNLEVIEKGAFTNYNDFENDGTDGKLTYTGDTKVISINATISFSTANPELDLVFALAVNGTAISYALDQTRDADRCHTVNLHTIAELEADDYIEAYVGNMTEVSDVTIKSITITAHG